jgi:orotate phosphoribosyltransferase
MLDPHGAHLMAKGLLAEALAVGGEYVGGLEMGAVPITGAICQLSYTTGTPVSGFFVRKKAKEHGARKLIEGLRAGETLRGKRVVVVEDVTTSGASALVAVEACREEGANVRLVVSVVDRCEGAAKAFADEGIPFKSLFVATDFLSRLTEAGSPIRANAIARACAGYANAEAAYWGIAVATSLIHELQLDAANAAVSASNLLWKALILAAKLEVSDVPEWIDKELSGYRDGDTLPSYRILRGTVKGRGLHGWLTAQF